MWDLKLGALWNIWAIFWNFLAAFVNFHQNPLLEHLDRRPLCFFAFKHSLGRLCLLSSAYWLKPTLCSWIFQQNSSLRTPVKILTWNQFCQQLWRSLVLNFPTKFKIKPGKKRVKFSQSVVLLGFQQTYLILQWLKTELCFWKDFEDVIFDESQSFGILKLIRIEISPVWKLLKSNIWRILEVWRTTFSHLWF